MCIAYTIYLISCMCNFWWESICPQLCHNLSLLEEDHLCCLNTHKKKSISNPDRLVVFDLLYLINSLFTASAVLFQFL